MLQRQPLGVLLVAARLPASDRERLRSRDIPVVMVDPAGTPAPDVPSIGSADWNGGFLATRHLLDLGHRDIGIITGPDDMLASTARLSGYRAALESAGVPVDPAFIRPGQFHHRDGLIEGRALLCRAPAPDGDLRVVRPAGPRRLRGGPLARAVRSDGPVGRRLRRPADRPVGRSAAHDDPRAAGGDGRAGRRT